MNVTIKDEKVVEFLDKHDRFYVHIYHWVDDYVPHLVSHGVYTKPYLTKFLEDYKFDVELTIKYKGTHIYFEVCYFNIKYGQTCKEHFEIYPEIVGLEVLESVLLNSIDDLTRTLSSTVGLIKYNELELETEENKMNEEYTLILMYGGDDDFEAMQIERGNLIELAKDKLSRFYRELEYNVDKVFHVDGCEFRVRKISGKLSRRLVEFLKDNYMDYDALKCSNFEVLDELDFMEVHTLVGDQTNND